MLYRRRSRGGAVDPGLEAEFRAQAAARAVDGGAPRVSRHARRLIEDRFSSVFRNDDVRTYATARKVLDDAYLWLEEGMVRSEA